VIDLGQTFVADEPHRDLISVFVPRELLEDRLPDLPVMHGRRVAGPCTDLLINYFNLIASSLPGILTQSGEALGKATCDMVVACVKPSIENVEIARPQLEGVLVRRAKRHIQRETKSPALSVETLAHSLGVSRRTLYRAFEPAGGTQKFILAARLDGVRDELLDQSRRRKISEIADEFGFTRMDYFSRVFKKRFGGCPVEMRQNYSAKEAMRRVTHSTPSTEFQIGSRS
jgi:AraC-like DNA-binding protein